MYSVEESLRKARNNPGHIADELLWDALSDKAQLAIGRLFLTYFDAVKEEAREDGYMEGADHCEKLYDLLEPYLNDSTIEEIMNKLQGEADARTR